MGAVLFLRLSAGKQNAVTIKDADLQQIVRQVVERVLVEKGQPSDASPATPAARTVALGADHGGLAMKQDLAAYLVELGYAVSDCGTFTADPVDYPDVAYAVAKLVSDGAAARGVIVDGAGIGSAMAANKVPGVRAALCYDLSTARNAREHNDANVLTLGARLIGPGLARDIVKVFLETLCTEERHKKRVEKIMQVERRFLKK
jgi:RpiB/LacA/LacB family sugar-phosphate isomerase